MPAAPPLPVSVPLPLLPHPTLDAKKTPAAIRMKT